MVALEPVKEAATAVLLKESVPHAISRHVSLPVDGVEVLVLTETEQVRRRYVIVDGQV